MSECLLICFVFNIVLLFKVKGQYLEQQQNRKTAMKTYGKFSSYGDLQNAVFAGAANWLEFGQCVRIYDKNGTHVLSLLPCQDSSRSAYDYDLCTPDGKVHMCGVGDVTVSTFVEFFGIEDFHHLLGL